MTHKKGYFARARFLLTAPSKVRRIADEIRRKPYPQAMALLESLPHKGAKLLRKVVASAAANAAVRQQEPRRGLAVHQGAAHR